MEMQQAHLKRRGNSETVRTGIMGVRWYVLVLCGGLVAMLLGIGVFLSVRSRRQVPDPNSPILAAEYFVKIKAGPGAILNFSPPDWTKIATTGDEVRVSGFVEEVMRDGRASNTYNYQCVLREDSDRQSWDLVNLDVMKQ